MIEKEESFKELTKVIYSRLLKGKRVRRTLPQGRIHIDRSLPFLCVYRHPVNRKDKGTEQFVKGEASYLIASGKKSFQKGLRGLVTHIVKAMSPQFGSFLIVEIFSSSRKTKKTSIPKPKFRLRTDQQEYSALTPVLSCIEEQLGKMQVSKVKPEINICCDIKPAPSGYSSLISNVQRKNLKCYVIGLEIQPIYQTGKQGKLYPMVLRSLHHGVSRALKQGYFKFSQTLTTQKPRNYQTLGRRAVVKAVWEIDRQLAEISNAFNSLMLITPVNSEEAWKKFQKIDYQETPEFFYRPLPVDPILLKRKLYDIPVERVEDPTLEDLFREKQTELAQRLTLLHERGTKRFLYGNHMLYGEIDDKLVTTAKGLLRKLSSGEPKEDTITAAQFKKRVEKEISYYKKQYAKFKSKVIIRSDIPGALVVGENLLLGAHAKVSTARAYGLIQHEVGTHIVTYVNGTIQPLRLMYAGLAGYEELQEGIAVLAEYLVGEFTRSRLRTIAARVVAAKCLVDGKTFVETFHKLVKDYQINKLRAFRIVTRTYRSGGSIKDIIYLRGLIKMLKYFREGGELEPLYVGKFSFDHIPVIQELLSREILKPAVLQPRFLDLPESKERIKRLRKGLSPLELVVRRKK